ncbi:MULTISPECIES: HAD family hydrolase [unclassified Mucilaginibacter]|uniref:HAD family hydrolase n=1 Tax=unclassified Mucilaginibacter TaxID=2617802 RepID=UPI000967F6EE|nr:MULTISPECIES: HAD family hydrolase [unclassified Mucilaginibacter]OJW12797.1 MAG: hypothetical protein BGO48_02635 [Mucilaginibacter sp. 44-25]PLW90674.1 MAG: HAD family hydrolase [Mucilaginibacter sp.]PMP65436.1 MAG: HAD family hydrolase [Mucilaginibacter sp.]HEK21529.1 HAD family hydrolase [Bacteroidota bacterium]
MKRALILDLDNTIYPVKSIAADLFEQLFQLIDEEIGLSDKQKAAKAKSELTRRPYQHVADEYGFSKELKQKGLGLLKNFSYDKPMQPYPEYHALSALTIDKFLVTTGFTKLQNSKIEKLGIKAHFKKVYIVDPEVSKINKGDIFQQIMLENGYNARDLLVIGDDPQSEIKFARELGIDTYLFDPEQKFSDVDVTHRSASYTNVADIINQ